MKLHEGNLKNNYQYTDFYLEQIAILCAESLKDEYSKFKVYEVMSYHKFFCHNSMCYCKYSTMSNISPLPSLCCSTYFPSFASPLPSLNRTLFHGWHL